MLLQRSASQDEMNGSWHDNDTYNADKNVEVWNENI